MQEITHAQDEKTSVANQNSTKGSSRRRGGLLAVIIAGAIVVIGVVAVITGWLAVSFKQPDQRVIVRTEVCGDSVINAYNTAMIPLDTSASTPSAVTNLIADFSKNVNYQKDPTCLYIKFAVFLRAGNHADANKMYEQTVKLADQGIYASAKLYSVTGLDGMGRALALIKPASASTGTDMTEAGND